MSQTGILGMNARNLRYIRSYNTEAGIKLVDSKLDTKNLLRENDIPTPKFYGVIENVAGFDNFNFNKLPQSFAVKPNRGFGGGGILVLKGSEKKADFLKKPIFDRIWIGSGGKEFTFSDLKVHILDILYGKFSLSNAPDVALIEKKIVVDSRLLELCGSGVPDIRVVVFNNVPVMAMLRLPTIESSGRANIAMGGVGVGIDLGSGETTAAFMKTPRGRMIEEHPDTGKDLLGFFIPEWPKILKMAVESQFISGLGFMGVDIVFDKRDGPLILELNARPGLGIQSSNLDGLRGRLERVTGLQVKTAAKGVRIGRELFGGDVERRVEDMTGRKVIGMIEEVSILGKNGKERSTVKAKVDTGAKTTSIDIALAKKLGYKKIVDVIKDFSLGEKGKTEKELRENFSKIESEFKKKNPQFEELSIVKSSSGHTLRPVIKLVYYLSGEKITTLANIADRSEMTYQMLIGKNDMEHFLIDPILRNS